MPALAWKFFDTLLIGANTVWGLDYFYGGHHYWAAFFFMAAAFNLLTALAKVV